MKCNRKACSSEEAIWYHRIMKAWYCTRCKNLIEDNNPGFSGWFSLKKEDDE